MYQIQVRRYDSKVWQNTGRPWLTKQAASSRIAELTATDEGYGEAGV